MMEALRIIKAAGLQAGRTIPHLALCAEEGAFSVRKTLATEHLGTQAAPKPKPRSSQAYVNLYMTGQVRGIGMQTTRGESREPILCLGTWR